MSQPIIAGIRPIATQKEELRQRLNTDKSSQQLSNFLQASVELMNVMARACGHTHLNQFNKNNLATWNHDMARSSGVMFSGFRE